MVGARSIAVCLATVLLAAPVWSQGLPPTRLTPRSAPNSPARASKPLFSASVAERFREIGYELAHAESLTEAQADQAIILLTAARSLNGRAAGVEPLLLRVALRHAEKDYSEQVILWLQSYVDETADRAIVSEAIQYLVDRAESQEQRERVLLRIGTMIGNRNAAIDSELGLRLGLLMLEKGDTQNAVKHLSQAYITDKYNRLAFAKLAEVAPNEVGRGAYLEHLRFVVRENPLDIIAAQNFAQYAERLQLYDVAAPAYQYAAELFRYLYPSAPLPAQVYLPWAISCYNSEQYRPITVQIAENVRNMGHFDILLEAIAGKAAARAGNPQEAQRIFRQAAQRARQLLQAGPTETVTDGQDAMTAARELNPKHFAWFYCFADPQPAPALDWANRAYSAEPNSPPAAALLAYALSMNDQLEWAKPLLESFEHTQSADIVQARLHLSEGRTAEAVRTLRLAVGRDPASLAAEKAREMLREMGSEYRAPVDPKVLAQFLRESFGDASAPTFVPPDEMFDVRFGVRGTEASYGSDLEATIAIANRGAEPLVITSDSLFQGNIRIDARVSGDLEDEIPKLVAETIRNELTVEPGKSLVHTLSLSTGELRDLLQRHPQASLDLQFTLYLDPVTTDANRVSNRLVDIEPITISVRRPKVEVDARYVRSRFNAISSAQEGQKIQTARLFTGLLKEQYVMAEQGTLYAFRYAEWLPGLLRSALTADSGLLLGDGPSEWIVKVHTMADMLSMPIDQDLATVIAKNLNHPRWPVRLMTVYLLSATPGNNFANLLDWVARNDANELVRSIAMSLQSSLSDPPAAPVASDAGGLRYP